VIDCPDCHTPVDDGLEVCPYCEKSLKSDVGPSKTFGRRRAKVVVTINLKKGNPISEVALDRLNLSITSHQDRGTGVLKLIHGYGSKGLGGIIRNVVRERLEHLRYNREIRDFIHGEDLAWADQSRFPSGYQPDTADIGNEGITIAIL